MAFIRPLAIGWVISFAQAIWIPPISGSAAETIQKNEPDYSILAGEWQRIDGEYLIRVVNVNQDGSTVVKYFNPRPIHVSKSLVTMRKNLLQLFVKLQDEGYPGSTYTLYYYKDKDALAGFYYQAAINQTYKVIFLRKK